MQDDLCELWDVLCCELCLSASCAAKDIERKVVPQRDAALVTALQQEWGGVSTTCAYKVGVPGETLA